MSDTEQDVPDGRTGALRRPSFLLPQTFRHSQVALSFLLFFGVSSAVNPGGAGLFHTVLFWAALIYGAAGFFGLLGATVRMRRTVWCETHHRLTAALPEALLFAWGLTHLIGCSYRPFNTLAVTVWLIYFAVGFAFAAARWLRGLFLPRVTPAVAGTDAVTGAVAGLGCTATAAAVDAETRYAAPAAPDAPMQKAGVGGRG